MHLVSKQEKELAFFHEQIHLEKVMQLLTTLSCGLLFQNHYCHRQHILRIRMVCTKGASNGSQTRARLGSIAGHLEGLPHYYVHCDKK